MSGGSYNYLENKEPTDLFGSSELLEMVVAYEHDFPNSQAAIKMRAYWRELVHTEQKLITMHTELKPMMHAMEWWHSSDWGKDQVDREVAAFEQQHKPALVKKKRSTT